MTEIYIMPDELREIASSFRKANKDSQKIVADLDEAMATMRAKWQGSTQQLFYQKYIQWRDHSAGYAELLSNIAREIEAIAERFAKADV